MDDVGTRVLRLLDATPYLHQAVPGIPGACSVCRGAMRTIDRGRYTTCFQCNSRPHGIFDHLGFGIYALPSEQSAADMFSYKAENRSSRAEGIVKALTYQAIHCALSLPGPGFDSVVTVPSLSGRRGRHALDAIADSALRQFMDAPPLVHCLDGSHIRDRSRRRDMNPAHFVFLGARPPGNVLLIDDTWTTGGHLTSAAMTLRKAGATGVTAVALCRWLQPDPAYTGAALFRESEKLTGQFADYDFFSGLRSPDGLF